MDKVERLILMEATGDNTFSGNGVNWTQLHVGDSWRLTIVLLYLIKTICSLCTLATTAEEETILFPGHEALPQYEASWVFQQSVERSEESGTGRTGCKQKLAGTTNRMIQRGHQNKLIMLCFTLCVIGKNSALAKGVQEQMGLRSPGTHFKLQIG